MKNLFIIDGASGTGKSDLVHYVADFHIDVDLVEKSTTRSQRDHEKKKDWKLDLTFVSEREFERLKPDYQYRYRGHKYGFSRAQLDSCLSQSANVLVIVRNADVIRHIVDDYSFINVVPTFVYTDHDKVRERFLSQGISETRLQFRLERIEFAFQDYLRHPNIYREVLINNSSREDYHRLIDLLLAKYRTSPDIDEKLVFLLMSFNPDLVDYSNAIKRAVKRYDSSFRCINLEDMAGSFKISQTAKKNVRNCRLAIVDLTENRPNVYYELGYVHGIAKNCIITAHIDTPRFSYPSEYKIVYYRNASELEDKLMRELEGVLGVSVQAMSDQPVIVGSERDYAESSPIKVLFLTANPLNTTQLRLDKEIREIDQALQKAEFRSRFSIEQHWAVRVTDLQESLLRHKPDIVHFSGHGSKSSEIVLEDNQGDSHPISIRALSQLFSVLKDNIRCVVLNACYSDQQAQAISKHIDCVIGMSKTVGDSAAISFAAAFYQALGYGRDVKTAFDLGCVQIDLENLGEQDVPKLLATKSDPESVFFVHED